jgi:hypothetical protein
MSVVTSTSRRSLTSLPVWVVSVGAGGTAALATEVYGLIARAVGVPMSAGGLSASTADEITPGMFAMGTLICTFWGTLIAVGLARWANQPARTYRRITLALVVLSLAAPALAGGDTAVSTKLMLCLAHGIAAAIVIPAVSYRLSHHDGRQRAH